jgi:hypothetical protein
MAIDVIARPADKCMSLVCDAPAPAITSVAMIGATIRASLEDGSIMDIGELTDSMRLDVERCSICVVTEMDGNAVVAFRQVDFQ